VDGAEFLGKLTGNHFWWKTAVFRIAAMKRHDGWVELITAVAESSRTTGGDGSRCGVASLVLQPPYIQSGCCEAVHRGMPSTSGEVASMHLD
jgi:hypothetical protein